MENTNQLTPHEVAHPDYNVATAVYFGNYDDEETAFQLTVQKRLNILSMVIYSIAFVVGVLGNGLVFITGFRMKKTVNTVWFLNLAIADFIFTFFLPLSIAYLALDFHWPFGEAMYKFISSVGFISHYASAYFLMVISVDRCLSVLFPVWAQNHRNPCCASLVAFVVWIVALVLSSTNAHYREIVQAVIPCHNNCRHDPKQAEANYRAMIIIRFIFIYVIPFLVIVICYGAIVLRLKRDRLARSSKPFKVITAVIVASFVCWLPYHIFSFLEIQVYKDLPLHLVLIVGFFLASSLSIINSCLKPILYVFMGHNFKERLKRSILSVFENAFTEEESQSMTQTEALDDIASQDL